MKIFKKILKITGISILSIILLLLLIPVVFKKQVQALVKKEINKSLDATVDFKDVKLSLFRNFPKASIRIKGLSIVGKGYYAKDTLLAADEIDVTAGLFSVLKGKDVKVYAVHAQSPRIHLLVNELGKANWDIAKPTAGKSTSADTTTSNFQLKLKQYKISNGYLEYSDKQANTHLEMDQFNHKGRGDLSAEIFTLSTSTEAPSVRFTQDQIPYLNNTKTTLDADIKIDTKTNTYSFKTDEIRLNALNLAADGFVQMVNAQTFRMDFRFSSTTNEFKQILSLVPAMYSNDFTALKTSGQASFKGFVKGTYSSDQLPAYDVKLLVNNGSFQYPDLPGAVQHIKLKLHAANTTGLPDDAIVDISEGHLEFDNEPFDFHLRYTNPVTAQHMDAAVKGKLDLDQLPKFIRLEKGTTLKGSVWADAFAKGPLHALQKGSGPFTAGGFLDIKNLYYADKSFPHPVKNGNIKATITNTGGIADNTSIDIHTAHLEIDNDPVDFTLHLTQPVSAVNFNGHVKGRLTLDHLKQFNILPSGASLSGTMNADAGFSGSQSAIHKKQYDKITMTGNAAFAGVNYASSASSGQLNIPAANLAFNTTTVALTNTSINYLGSNLVTKGTLTNLIGYLADNQVLAGDITVTADNIDLNKWMGSPASSPTSTTAPSSSETPTQPFVVPPNMNMAILAAAGKLTYDKVDYTNLSGKLLLNDEKILLQNVKANALDGNITVNGSYSTKINKSNPDISLGYDIKSVDVQKAFYAYTTSNSLLPVGKYLSGKLSSELSLIGNLDGNMVPMLNSLTGKGNMLLLEGVLAKFAPLEKIAAILDIDKLKSISIKDVKSYIEFSNGKVLVKPFTLKVQGIEMEIAGLHGLDQSINYGIIMKLPRALMGTKGNALVDNLISSANAKGIPVKAGTLVTLSLKVTGSISNPSVSVNLKDLAGDAIKELGNQAEDFAKAKADSLLQKTRDSLSAVKAQAEQKAKEKLAQQGIDTTNLNIKNVKDTLVHKVADSLKKRGKDSLKKKLKNLLN